MLLKLHELNLKTKDFFKNKIILLYGENQDLIKDFNEQIINQSTCSMCMERVVNIRIDCGHLFCSNCVINIIECPLCRNQITSFAKIFLKKYLKYRTKYMKLKNKLHNKV